ncbi:Centromere-associated protein E [Apis cerana cerana]|uniref:Centromere-associated protein E n=1 Tax=Apis cerana cerana TaxID=94128 RepID=A0A2A3EJR6_APICC|nr:Centromere-associated protein E [Apis cerana cerana]
MSDSIKVAIKVRPLIKREKDDNLSIQWTVQENSIVSTDLEMKKRGDGRFIFDHIFDVNASNSDVFNIVVKPIVNAAVNGFNGTVFAYGQTSSGKTYTMMGGTEELGIIPLAVQYMFDTIANTMGREFLLRVSYLEIYNERVNDLLNKNGTDLKLKEDGNGQVILLCKEEITNSPENVLSIMKKGNKNRRTGETNMNERSSRSHTIFRITIESREAGGDSDSAIQVSQLNLIDLAGSERARQTGATGERFKEGRHINLSLSTLSLVIKQLSESQDNQKHVNFRDSKLTRLLQNSLGGNAMTAIICAVTPVALEETQCTLSFAYRAKSVKNKPQINEVMSDGALLKRYAKQLAKLQQELEKIKNENRSEEVKEMESKLQEKDRINQLLEERIELLKTRIVSGDNTNQKDSLKYEFKRRQTWGGPGMFNHHLAVFQSKTGLPTIKEISEIPSRKSIIQSMDIMNQTFQTAFTDFELELFETERERESRENISDSDEESFVIKHKNRVTFRDDVVNIKPKNNSFDVTPEKSNSYTQTVSYQISPSTPKHVLRRYITDLTKEFVELREFTTLERQLICQCHTQDLQTEIKPAEQIKSTLKYYKPEYNSEVKEQLVNLNLAEETNSEYIISELCIKLNQIQKQNISEKKLLEKKIKDITSEKNEFEYISRELRAELKSKTAELDLKIMSEENIRQEETSKISELEKKIEDIISEKNKLECININLHSDSTKKITELQKQVENITSEKNEFEHMRRELHIELNKKSIELEKMKNNSENIETVSNRIIELETIIENITTEKNKFKCINDDLHTELNRISAEFALQIASEQTEKQKVIEKASELEKHIEEIISNKNENFSIELKNELDKKIIDLESKIESEQALNQEAVEKISKLEKKIENIISEKNELEIMNTEFSKNVSELKSMITSQQTAYQKANDKISELEEKLENTISEKNEFQHINIELHAELDKKCSEFELTIMSKENENLIAMEKISEIEKQIMNITFEKNELERINSELRIELEQKNFELKEKTMTEESKNLKIMEKIFELETQINNITSEKDEYKRINIELRAELNAKISELNLHVISNEIDNQTDAKMISEEIELKCTNDELYTKLNQTTNDLKTKVYIKETEYQNTSMKFENNEQCSINKDLCIKLAKKISALKTKVITEKIENQKVKEIIDELEIEIENIISKNDEIEHIITQLYFDLDKKTSTLELEQIKNQKTTRKISELNKQIECIMSEQNENLNHLNLELEEKSSELESRMLKQITCKEDIKATSELEKQIENINLQNNELENVVELHYTENKEILEDIQTTNQDLKEQLKNESNLSFLTMNETNADNLHLTLNIEAEKSYLEETLQLKSQELEDIKNDVQSLKTDIKNLQETIYLLTTENMEMTTKLTVEQENAKQTEINLQKTIDELYTRISQVTNEKITLQSDLAALNDQLESVHSKMPTVYNEKELFESYQNKIDKLTTENIELSASIAEKNIELENIKESKSLLYDHDCIYKKEVVILKEQNECLQMENNELSTELIDKIEENDMLKEQCNILKIKIEQSLVLNENVAENDIEHLKTENNNLKLEIAELKTKVTILSEENEKFSTSLLESIDNLDSVQNEKSCNNSLYLSKVFNDSTDINEIEQEILETDEKLENKVITLQNKIDHLTRLNKRLSDLKLTSCNQCTHLRNMNESYRALKLETKILNQKLKDLQRKYDRKCVDTDILKNKVNQELNSSEHDLSSNIVFVNEMNVSFVEKKIQNLNNELQTLKTEHDKLLILYENEHTDSKLLQSDMTINASNIQESQLKENKSENRIEQIQIYIDHIRNDIDKIKENSINFTAILNEFKSEKINLLDEINNLKDINEELEQKILNNESTAINKIQILENELINMNKEIDRFTTQEKELETQRIMLEVELEGLKVEEEKKNILISELNEHIFSLKNELDLIINQRNELINSTTIKCKEEELKYLKEQCEKFEKEKLQSKELEHHNVLKIKELEICINDLQRNITNQENISKEYQEKNINFEKLLQEKEEEKHNLIEKLQASETEIINMKNNLEMEYKNELDSMVLQHQQYIKENDNNIKKLNDTLNKYIDENLNLTQELTNLQNIKEKLNEITIEKEHLFDEQKTLINDKEQFYEELNDVKKCIIKELSSLKCNINLPNFSNKSANEIFIIFLQTLLSKEEEVIKTVRETYEKEKQKVEEEKQQCIDTERRTVMWAKELEAEIEKLQTDLTEEERSHKEYQNKIFQLEHFLKESNHENEMLKEKMNTLETDFIYLQAEFDKQHKVDNQQEEAIFEAQKREKEAQEMFKSKEVELQLKLKSEKEMYEKKINNFIQTIECYKTKNFELNNTIEGLEINEKQLKNIIEANSSEIKKKNENIEKINAEFDQLTQVYNEINQEMRQKNSHIEEITTILKNKCDLLSEYKIKLETILPEYEMLKEHVKDQKLTIEQYKEEIEVLKKEREEQLEIIKDKLNMEEIKNASLSKHLNELNNKNISIIEELNSLKERFKELQETNIKLEKKIRNSTSKIKAEAEIEELKELNKRLQNNLEGASNRVAEFQEIKNQTLKDLIDIKGKYELILQENNELKKTFSLYNLKHITSNSLIDESKYDALLLEKNKIALELEDKKILLNQKDKDIKEHVTQVQKLIDKNKELDDELEEYAAVIRERDIEISKLEEKLYSRFSENILINELEEKLKYRNEENEKLRDQVDALRMRLQMNVEENIKSQNENIVRDLTKQNLELQTKRWRINRKDQACQTIPNNTVRFCGTNSGVVEDRLKELEEIQSSFSLKPHEVLQDRSNQQNSNVTKLSRHLDIRKNP